MIIKKIKDFLKKIKKNQEKYIGQTGLTQNNIAMTCDLAGCVRPSDSGLAQIYKR